MSRPRVARRPSVGAMMPPLLVARHPRSGHTTVVDGTMVLGVVRCGERRGHSRGLAVAGSWGELLDAAFLAPTFGGAGEGLHV